jgi:hypothetical protein
MSMHFTVSPQLLFTRCLTEVCAPSGLLGKGHFPIYHDYILTMEKEVPAHSSFALLQQHSTVPPEETCVP